MNAATTKEFAELGGLQSARSQSLFACLVMALYVLAVQFEADQILAALIPLALWLAIAHPAFWAVVFMCLSLYRLPDAYPLFRDLSLPAFSGFFAVISMIWHVVIARSIKPYWSRSLVLMLVLFFIVVIGVPFGVDIRNSWKYLSGTYWKTIAGCLALAWLLRKESDFKLVANAILACGFLISLVAIHNGYFGIDLVEGTRVSIGLSFESPIGDPNDLALILLGPFCLALAFLVKRVDRKTTTVAAIVTVLTLVAIVLTKSRGGMLGILTAMASVGLNAVRSRTLVFAVCILAGVALFAAMGIAYRQSGGMAEISSSGLDESNYHRILAWAAAINMALSR